VINGVSSMLSAAHCGENGAAVNIDNQPSPTGTISLKSACRDTLMINFPGGTAQAIYTGGPTSATASAIEGATTDFVGNLINTGGASSGEHLNIPVQQVDVFTGLAGQPCNPNGPFTKASTSSTTCAVAPNDSGGPAYSYTGVGTNVLVRGTLSAGNGPVPCPGLFTTTGFNTVFYAPALRPAGGPTIGSLNQYGAQKPTATVFDLNGTWTDGPGRGPGPRITVRGTTIQIDMTAFHRPTATGAALSRSSIMITFADDATHTGQLIAPNTILWDNNSTWTKL
jgi:hypothetical protein